MIEQCQVVTTASSVLKEKLGEKAVVLPNGVCTREAGKGKGERIRRQHRTPIVGFLGAFEYFFDFDLILTVARSLPDVTFLLVGAGRGFAAVKRRVVQEELVNVVLPGPVPHHLVFDYIDAMDICLIPFRRSAVGDAACPLKLFEYAGAKKPIISTPVREVQIIGREFVTFVDTARELQLAIVELLRSPQRRTSLATRGFEIVQQQYNWDTLSEQFVRLTEAARKGFSLSDVGVERSRSADLRSTGYRI
jgi:glycosyltransferase involved in cell wall biosynthesis